MYSLNTVHRFLAAPILIFVALHLLNHIVSIIGVDSHIAYMDAFRILYRNPYVEIALFLSLFSQICIGLYFVFRSRRKRRGFFQQAQAFSGLYIVFFVLAHVIAVLLGRYKLGLDTNFYFAAAGMHAGQIKLFFVPYYFLSVVAVFTHVACFLHARMSQSNTIGMVNKLAILLITLGVLTGALIVASLGGVFYDFNVPNEYLDMF